MRRTAMRRTGTRTAVVTLGIAALAVMVPTTTAHAGPNCNGIYLDNPTDGNVRAFDAKDCYGGMIAEDTDNDVNWDEGGDVYNANDRAGSVMNNGFPDTYDIVAFYEHSHYNGGYACLTRGEKYADDLDQSKDVYTNGVRINNTISSHRWVSSCHWLVT